MIRGLLAIALMTANFLAFQNCGAGFKTSDKVVGTSVLTSLVSAPAGGVVNPSTGNGFQIAAHSAMPVLQFQGGRVLTPKIKSITFAGDSMAPSIHDFAAKFAVSSELKAMTSEYGVGNGSYAGAIHISTAAPAQISKSQIESWISAHLNSSTDSLGAPDNETILTLFFPSSSNVVDSSNKSFCSQGIIGYHDEFVDPTSNTKIIYAFVLRCSAQGYDSLNDVTSTATHEIAEAATDPDEDVWGYYDVDSGNEVWASLSGGENGDLCEIYQTSQSTPADLGYEIQRTWSNAAAAAGQNPCVPVAAGEVYFNSAPVLPDTVVYFDSLVSQQNVSNKGVKIPVGQSRTIQLQLYSSAATSAPWTVSASEAQSGTSTAKNLAFSFDKTSGQNGDVINLTITVNSQDAGYKAEIFFLKSSLNGVNYYWPVVVGN